MRARSIKYFLQEGVKSFLKNGLMSTASVITVTLCLILFGVYIVFSLNLNYATKQVESNYEIQAFIEQGTPPSRMAQIKDNIKAIDNVNDAVFISNEEALENWKKQFGKNSEILDGLELDNPLRDSYKVTFKDLKSVDDTVAQIEAIADIALVKNNKDVMDKLVNITSIVKNISLCVMIFFASISIFIISNAIRLTVFARRREVNIMKFVGATDSFISIPFIIEGIIIGIIGSLISLFAISQAYNYFLKSIGLMLGSSFNIYPLSSIIWILFVALAGMGIVLGAIGSAISLRRHLHV